jgi:hypothetical protein
VEGQQHAIEAAIFLHLCHGLDERQVDHRPGGRNDLRRVLISARN